MQSLAYTLEQRRLVVQKMLTPLLMQVPEPVLVSYFVKNIGVITAKIQSDLPKCE